MQKIQTLLLIWHYKSHQQYYLLNRYTTTMHILAAATPQITRLAQLRVEYACSQRPGPKCRHSSDSVFSLVRYFIRVVGDWWYREISGSKPDYRQPNDKWQSTALHCMDDAWMMRASDVVYRSARHARINRVISVHDVLRHDTAAAARLIELSSLRRDLLIPRGKSTRHVMTMPSRATTYH